MVSSVVVSQRVFRKLRTQAKRLAKNLGAARDAPQQWEGTTNHHHNQNEKVRCWGFNVVGISIIVFDMNCSAGSMFSPSRKAY